MSYLDEANRVPLARNGQGRCRNTKPRKLDAGSERQRQRVAVRGLPIASLIARIVKIGHWLGIDQHGDQRAMIAII